MRGIGSISPKWDPQLCMMNTCTQACQPISEQKRRRDPPPPHESYKFLQRRTAAFSLLPQKNPIWGHTDDNAIVTALLSTFISMTVYSQSLILFKKSFLFIFNHHQKIFREWEGRSRRDHIASFFCFVFSLFNLF